MKLSNKPFKFIIPVALLTILISLTVYNFIFSIYEVKIITEPDAIFADTSSEVKIMIKPVNALGCVVPFRKARGKFRFLEGSDLVEIILKNENTGLMILRSKGIAGKISLSIISEYSFLPSLVEIKFLTKSV